MKKYKTGLVLSGGGARGFAHLGVIEALNEVGIYPDVISGTSAGAIAGSLYADGHSPREIMEMLHSHKRLDYIWPAVPKDGFLQISGIEKILKANLRAKSFEELKIPLFVSVTDLNNGKPVYFSKGELINPVIASASIPVLFKPVIINKIQYVDGGVLDNLPVRPIEHQCRLYIGSFVNPAGYEKNFTNLIQIAERTFMLNMSKEVMEKSRKFDIFISPSELKNYKILDPEKSDEVFQIGYDATKEILKGLDIKGILQKNIST